MFTERQERRKEDEQGDFVPTGYGRRRRGDWPGTRLPSLLDLGAEDAVLPDGWGDEADVGAGGMKIGAGHKLQPYDEHG